MKATSYAIVSILVLALLSLWLHSFGDKSFLARVPDYAVMKDNGQENDSVSPSIVIADERLKYTQKSKPFNYGNLFYLIPAGSVLCLIIAFVLQRKVGLPNRFEGDDNEDEETIEEEHHANPMLNETVEDLEIPLSGGGVSQTETIEDDGSFRDDDDLSLNY